MPNKVIFSVAEQLLLNGKIKYFEREYQVKSYLFDMFIIGNDDNRMFIEMDGEQHDINKLHGIWASRKENIITNDQNKNELASEIGIPLVRIDCYKSDVMYIKSNILNSDLSKILDLSVIDWNKVGDFCYGNFVKNVCEYWKSNPGITTLEMAKIFHVS